MNVIAKLFAAAVFAVLLTLPAHAGECVAADNLAMAGAENAPQTGTAIGATRDDRVGRMVAPVMVNGQGPFRFIVDTGANRSVLSQDLADQLGLAPIGIGEVHSVHGVTSAPIVQIDSLSYGALNFPSQPLPLLQGPVLAGQQGLLGVDGMAGRRLRMDFARRCIEISPSRESTRLAGFTTVRGRLRFGHLVVLQGRIRNVPVNVLIDTGSDTTLANYALRDALRARAQSRSDLLQYSRAYSAGEPIVLDDAIAMPELRLGDLMIGDLVAYVGDFHIFRLWELQDEPTLMLGMDVLRRTRAVAIDYGRGTVHFRLRGAMATVDYGSGSRYRR